MENAMTGDNRGWASEVLQRFDPELKYLHKCTVKFAKKICSEQTLKNVNHLKCYRLSRMSVYYLQELQEV